MYLLSLSLNFWASSSLKVWPNRIHKEQKLKQKFQGPFTWLWLGNLEELGICLCTRQAWGPVSQGLSFVFCCIGNESQDLTKAKQIFLSYISSPLFIF